MSVSDFGHETVENAFMKHVNHVFEYALGFGNCKCRAPKRLEYKFSYHYVYAKAPNRMNSKYDTIYVVVLRFCTTCEDVGYCSYDTIVLNSHYIGTFGEKFIKDLDLKEIPIEEYNTDETHNERNKRLWHLYNP